MEYYLVSFIFELSEYMFYFSLFWIKNKWNELLLNRILSIEMRYLMYGRVMGAFGGTRCIKFVGQDFYGAVYV